MFQDERIKTVRKTTKWKFDASQELRHILTNCEQHSMMARRGGKASPFHLNRDSEEIKIDRIMDVSRLLYVTSVANEPTG